MGHKPIRPRCGFFKRSVQSGVTLVELVLSMVIISIALTGVLTVMNLTVSHSADPVIQHQAVAIAESYLEEILLQPYADPDGSDGEVSRDLFDDVDDYNNLPDTKVRDQIGTEIVTLAGFSIVVLVAPEIVINTVAMKQITVTVSTPANSNIVLVGYRGKT